MTTTANRPWERASWHTSDKHDRRRRDYLTKPPTGHWIFLRISRLKQTKHNTRQCIVPRRVTRHIALYSGAYLRILLSMGWTRTVCIPLRRRDYMPIYISRDAFLRWGQHHHVENHRRQNRLRAEVLQGEWKINLTLWESENAATNLSSVLCNSLSRTYQLFQRMPSYIWSDCVRYDWNGSELDVDITHICRSFQKLFRSQQGYFNYKLILLLLDFCIIFTQPFCIYLLWKKNFFF